MSRTFHPMFICNKPFMYFIQDTETGTIIFSGRLETVEPTQNPDNWSSHRSLLFLMEKYKRNEWRQCLKEKTNCVLFHVKFKLHKMIWFLKEPNFSFPLWLWCLLVTCLDLVMDKIDHFRTEWLLFNLKSSNSLRNWILWTISTTIEYSQ